MMALVFWLSLCCALGIGIPVAFALVLSGFGVAMLSFEGMALNIVPTLLVQTMFGGANSFLLVALPLFFFAGGLMEAGGMADRLIKLGLVLIGWVRGGLSIVAVVAGVFMSGISGSASSDAAAIGSVLIPAMKKRGYPAGYASAVSASAGALGPILPPSILMIVYGSIAEVSIIRLFLAGIVPGLIIAACLIAVCAVIAKRRDYPREDFPGAREAARVLIDALIPLGAPVIILGGVFGGVFTATESAAVAVVYCLVVSVFVYRALSLSKILDIAYNSALATARVLLIIAAASFVGWVLARERIPQEAAGLLLDLTQNPIVILILINVAILIFAAFMDELALAVILLPTLLPILEEANIDLVFFGVLLVLNFAIGTLTPPVGNCLFVVSAVSETPIEKVIPELWPFILAMVGMLFLLCLLPGVVLWLPNMVLQ